MDLMQALDLIQTQFPQALPILTKPGVAKVYLDYVSASPPWTDAQLQSALQKTEYFQSEPLTQRQWDISRITDPATANQKIDDMWSQLKALESSTGLTLDYASALGFVGNALGQGWNTNQIRFHFLTSVNTQQVGTSPTGEIANSAAQIRATAQDYGVMMSDKATIDMAHQLAAGIQTPESVKGYMQEQAKSLYPMLSGAIDRGVTVAQYTDPYKQLAVQELGINPANFDLTDPKWNSFLNQIDPKTGQRTVLNQQEWQAKIRTDPTYNYDTTQAARTQAGQLATTIASKFGAI